MREDDRNIEIPPHAGAPSSSGHEPPYDEAEGRAVAEWHLPTRALRWIQHSGEALLGFPQRSAGGLDWLMTRIDPADRVVFEHGWYRIANGIPVEFECRLKNQLNAACWFRFTASPALLSEGRDVISMQIAVRNVHALRQPLEERLELRRARAMRDLAAGLSHEFSNHLTPICGFIELALESLSPEHPCAQDLSIALDRARRCGELIHLIQHSGKHSLLQCRRVCPDQIVAACVALGKSGGLLGRGISCRLNIQEHLPEVLIDPQVFQEALTQVLSNAVAAMVRGGVITLRVTPVSSSAGNEPDFVRISVIDTGSGIRPDDLPHIFDPFFTTRNRAENKGLGLSMVKGAMDRMGGWVEIRSEVDAGTEVSLVIPAAPPYDDASENSQNGERTAAPRRILANESDAYVLKLIAKVLSKEGWKVDEAGDLRVALDNFRTWPHRYDLLILDPGLHTDKTLPTFLAGIEQLPRPGVLFLGSASLHPELSPWLDHPRIKWLGKPFSPKKLVRIANEIAH